MERNIKSFGQKSKKGGNEWTNKLKVSQKQDVRVVFQLSRSMCYCRVTTVPYQVTNDIIQWVLQFFISKKDKRNHFCLLSCSDRMVRLQQEFSRVQLQTPLFSCYPRIKLLTKSGKTNTCLINCLFCKQTAFVDGNINLKKSMKKHVFIRPLCQCLGSLCSLPRELSCPF